MDAHAWKPGDAPEDHPLWECEVERERAMSEAGADKFRELARKAAEKANMTRLKPVDRLLVEWLPKVVDGIREWLRDARTNAKRQEGRGQSGIPVSVSMLRQIDPYLAAYVTLRTVLNLLSAEKTAVLTLAKDIGLALEHEARMEAWEKRDPQLFRKVQEGFRGDQDHAPATAVHRRRVNVNRFNALMREPLQWRDWSEHERTRLGLDLLDILIRYTKRFEIIPDPEWVPRKGRAPDRPFVLVPTPELLSWLTDKLERQEVLMPSHMPTIIPPRRWEGVRGGGYHTPYMRTPPLIRFKAHQEHQRGWAEQEYDSIDMPDVYRALHALQETPWVINRRVLDVALHMWKADMALAGMPSKEEFRKEPPIPGETEDEVKARKRRNTKGHAAFAKRTARIKQTQTILDIAETYAEFPEFYFPHMLDFRGRIYPIPVDLQPQGSDLARGLLTFTRGRPITFENGGAGWLAIHLANTFGKDKVSYDERIAWVEGQESLWRRIADDPLENRQWCEPGVDHFQALAAVFEWVRFLDEGYGMISALPIRVDGTCNGIQHLSALVRDAEGGSSVNLVPGPAPRDIYQETADPLTEILKAVTPGDQDYEHARWWLAFVNDKGVLPRSLTKRPVMIVPYGGSREAYFKYTREWLKEEHPAEMEALLAAEEAGVYERGELGRRIGFLIKHMWAAVAAKVTGAVETMKWLQDCAKHAAQGNQPIYWRTPSGFVVRHFYGKTKRREIRTKVDGQSVRLVEHVRTKDLDTREQLKGIPPNFVHSLDASALMTAIVMAGDQGISSFTAIHDAYGTVAADMWTLHAILREAFVLTHSEDVLGDYRKACLDVLAEHIIVSEKVPQDAQWEAYARADRILPQPLAKGTLDIEAVRDSDYFFG